MSGGAKVVARDVRIGERGTGGSGCGRQMAVQMLTCSRADDEMAREARRLRGLKKGWEHGAEGWAGGGVRCWPARLRGRRREGRGARRRGIGNGRVRGDESWEEGESKEEQARKTIWARRREAGRGGESGASGRAGILRVAGRGRGEAGKGRGEAEEAPEER